jgi:hypothetical protein
MRRVALATAAAIAVAILSPSTTALATQPATDPAAVVPSSQCCAATWFPWGYYSTEAKCKAEGKKIVREEPLAQKYACYRERDGRWHLYIPEPA